MLDTATAGKKVGYQGVDGAYSEEALVSSLPQAQVVACRTLAELFTALSDAAIDAALVPVENSYAGGIAEVYDLMLEHSVTVMGETLHRVHHFLLGIPGAEPSQVERVFSHPQALSQTAAFLRQANLDTEPYYDTAGAAQMVAERQDRRFAAVASRLAGERYGLSVLAEGIQTVADNTTRFLLIKSGAWSPDRTVTAGSPGKTSLVFAVDHRPGALVRALTSFSHQQVNLARLESRPSRDKPWEYLFFTDVEGYAHEPRLRTALRELTRLNPFVRVLGSYPKAEPLADGGLARGKR